MHEVFKIPNRHERERTSLHQIIVKMVNIPNKKGILKASREKHIVTYKGKSIRITIDLLSEILKARGAS